MMLTKSMLMGRGCKVLVLFKVTQTRSMVGEKAFSNMMNQCSIEEETDWDRREEETKNNNKVEVVMKLDRVPGLGMVEFISDIQRKVYCQALPSLGGKENLMGLSRCKLMQVYFS